MEFVILFFILCIGGGWLFFSLLGRMIFGSSPKEYKVDYKSPPTVINNYKTENHLHISKEELEELINKKHSGNS